MDRVREEETDKGSRMRRTVRVRDGQIEKKMLKETSNATRAINTNPTP